MLTQESVARVCVIGCGYWGKSLVRYFHSLGHLRGLLDTDQAQLNSFAAQYPEARIYRDWNEVLKDPEVGARWRSRHLPKPTAG